MRNLKDTFALKDIKASRDEEEDADSIKELSRTEEARMSQSFRAIQGNPSYQNVQINRTIRTEPIIPEYKGNYEPGRFLRPSDRIPIIDDDELGKRDATEGLSLNDDDGDLGQTIPKRGLESVKPRNSTDFIEKIEDLTTINKTVSWGSEGLVTKTSTLEGIHIIPPSTRESTPDSAIHTGTRFIQNMKSSAFSQQVPSTSQGANPSKNALPANGVESLQMQPRTHRNEKEEKGKPKGGHCWWRGLIFAMIVAAILAAVITVIVKYMDHGPPEPSGLIVDDPITHRECVDVKVFLGHPLNFTCTINSDHQQRTMYKMAEYTQTEVISPSKPLSPVKFAVNKIDTNGIQIWSFHGTNVSCSSMGMYRLIFKDSQKKILHEQHVTVSIIDPLPKATLRQLQVIRDGKLTNNTVFQLECSMAEHCVNYELNFIGDNRDSLNQFRYCNSSLGPDTGYTTQCTGKYSEDIIERYHQLSCQAKSVGAVSYAEFKLPECYNNCSKESARPYNCTERSPQRLALDTCDLGVIYRQRCFDTDRPIFAYKQCPESLAICTDDIAADHCRIGWCRIRNRYHNVIVKNEIPGKVLCEGFQEIQPTTPPPNIVQTSPAPTETPAPGSTTP